MPLNLSKVPLLTITTDNRLLQFSLAKMSAVHLHVIVISNIH